MVLVCDRDGPTGHRRDHGRPGLGGLATRPRGCCSRSRTGTGSTSCAPRASSGCAPTPRTGSRSSCIPSWRCARQRVASRLMVELCGAQLVPGTIDVTGEIPRAAPARAAGRARRARCSGSRSRSSAGRDYLERLEFEVERGRRRSRGDRAVHRHYDVTREVDLVEEVGRIHGYAENLPATLPAPSGQGGGLTREQRLRRRAEDVIRDLGFDGVVTPEPRRPGHAGRLRIPDDDPRARADRDLQPALGRALGDAHDAARRPARRRPLQPRPRRRAGGAVRVRPRLPAEGDRRRRAPSAGDVLGRAAGARVRARRIACLASAPCGRRGWRGEPEPAGLLLAQGRARGARRAARLRGRGRAGAGAVPAPGPRRPRPASAARRSAGSARSIRWSAAPGTCDGAPRASSSTSRRWSRPRRSAPSSYEDVITYPAVLQDIAVVVAEDVAAARVREAVARRPAASCCARPRSSTSTAASSSARGARASPCGSSSAAPDRTLTDEEVAELREAIEAALARDRRVAA